MERHSPENIHKDVRRYLVVFIALACLTVVTVALAHFHFPTHVAVTLALIVASIKGTLVAAVFMHLVSERKIIFAILGLTLIFFLLLLIYPAIF